MPIKTMKSYSPLALVAIFGLSLQSQAQAQPKEKKSEVSTQETGLVRAAETAAEAWLKIVDDADYAKSWSEAASYFRAQITSAQWEKQVGTVRGAFGKLVSRKVKTTKFLTSVPGGPDGKYVVIEFNSSFAMKKDAIETLTPMLDTDGKWHVSGYFIR